MCATGFWEAPDIILDVTVRHPGCADLRAAAATDAATAMAAEAEKLAKYPATAGRQVTPFAVETYGRLGPQAEAFIETIAATARKQAMRAGPEPGRAQARWRAALDAALHCCATGCRGGWPAG